MVKVSSKFDAFTSGPIQRLATALGDNHQAEVRRLHVSDKAHPFSGPSSSNGDSKTKFFMAAGQKLAAVPGHCHLLFATIVFQLSRVN